MNKNKVLINDKYDIYMLIRFVVAIFIFTVIVNWVSGGFISCHIQAISKDKYCSYEDTSMSNETMFSHYEWILKSHMQDAKDAIERQRIIDENALKVAENKRCYDKGYDYSREFDLVKDYRFNCKQLAYINDHLVDNTKKLSSGYVEGYFNGFLSYGNINGESYQYVTERILATGELIKHISYHVDCNGNSPSKTITPYTEGDAVMYYVNNCLK